ncbi:glycoside hydrolase family 3 C-terminal domain-containing protein [Streptacidiphilus sp. ASG 303]|uniref:glycoside hydrolase family 3 N-terminal domain-containing protein n=1 Tax=Streptacidiphilus sp. ASG 303 TaxID=2896847 RepID=UPI001E6236C2|nr:glycoside hydrolase family 3 N-terminal domain-containing protein [Streptacidiphilus sp. ASG 303]MCD0483583.1 glycoside hydrolase family 3 C-terminal domain-containing protein [Streptacidiphilus sp. ASG 303]
MLLGAMGAALVRGVQRHVMACAKHFALNSMENARFTVDVAVDERALHEVYLPHFRQVVEEGAAGIMSAYNAVNGEWCGQHPVLLTEVLREEWGFEGIMISDFVFGLRDAAASLAAGPDVEASFRPQRALHLPDDLAAGRARWEDVDRSALRILTTQLRFAARHHDVPAPGPEVVACAAHRALARTADPDGADSAAPDGPLADTGANLIGSFSTGGDRDRPTLHPEDEELVLAVADAHPRTVVGVVTAGAVLTGRRRHRVPALLMLWYAGMEGGNALADVLLGRCDAAGRLPFSVPEHTDHLPPFDRDARIAHYDLWHGQRLLDRRGRHLPGRGRGPPR